MKGFHLTAMQLIKVLLVQENDHFEIGYYNFLKSIFKFWALEAKDC